MGKYSDMARGWETLRKAPSSAGELTTKTILTTKVNQADQAPPVVPPTTLTTLTTKVRLIDEGARTALPQEAPGISHEGAKSIPPERLASLEARAELLDGAILFDLIHIRDAPVEEKLVYENEILARADAMIAEVEGRRPPPNQSVHDMFREARARFGSRDGEDRSITAWLRRHAPQVAVLWPDAPLTASWFDWRSRVPPQTSFVLDQAFHEVTRGSGSSHE